MKVNSIQQQSQNYKKSQNFNGFIGAVGKFVEKHPVAITSLAASSVVAQKIVMSGSEATIGPVVDIAVGKAITKATNEKDGRTNQSSKVQAIRTFSQSLGGTITGVIIRGLCIAAMGFLAGKGAQKASGEIVKILNPQKLDKTKDLFKFSENVDKWGKSIGGAVAVGVMMFTNFLIDAPFINQINKHATKFVDKHSKKSVLEQKTQMTEKNQDKEVK